jgi:hypothetical protein
VADLFEHALGTVDRHSAAHAAQLAPDPVAHERELHVVLGRPQQVERQPEILLHVACIKKGLGLRVELYMHEDLAAERFAWLQLHGIGVLFAIGGAPSS